MRSPKLVLAVAFAAAAAAAACPASSGPAGRWAQISRYPARVGLARGKDGILHVLWAGPAKIPFSAVFDTPISPAGAVGRARPVVTGWKAANAPAAATAPDGSIHVVISGARTHAPQDTTVGLNELVGPGAWRLGAHAYGCCNAENADVGAAALPDGTLVTVWVSASRLHVQRGTEPATQPQDITPPGFASSPSVVVDQRTGEAVIAYHGGTGGGGHGADYFRRVLPSLGAPQPIGPGNVDVPMIAARVGGGVYGAVVQIPTWKAWLVRYGGPARPLPLPKGRRRSGPASPRARRGACGCTPPTSSTSTSPGRTRRSPPTSRCRRSRSPPATTARCCRARARPARSTSSVCSPSTTPGTVPGTRACCRRCRSSSRGWGSG